MPSEYFLLVLPAAVIAVLLLVGSVGCNLQTTPLVGISSVRLIVTFDPALGGDDASFDVRLRIIAEDEGGAAMPLSNADRNAPDQMIDDDAGPLWQYEFDPHLGPGTYTITCQVFAYDAGGRPVTDGPIVQPAECHLVDPEGREVRFDAGLGEQNFTVTGCG